MHLIHDYYISCQVADNHIRAITAKNLSVLADTSIPEFLTP